MDARNYVKKSWPLYFSQNFAKKSVTIKIWRCLLNCLQGRSINVCSLDETLAVLVEFRTLILPFSEVFFHWT